jgi:hypothetical protein
MNIIASVIGFNLLKLHDDFDRILLFVSEICDVADVFITMGTIEGHLIQSKIGVKGLSSPNEISFFGQLIEDNVDLIVSDVKRDLRFRHIVCNDTFKFFAGFPINIAASCLITGTICILNRESKELSSIELRILKEAISQIESLLQFQIKNQELQGTKNKIEINFSL